MYESLNSDEYLGINAKKNETYSQPILYEK